MYYLIITNNHSTTYQAYKILNYISSSLEDQKFCSAVLSNIHQAFHKVWPRGLMLKHVTMQLLHLISQISIILLTTTINLQHKTHPNLF